ncbi:MAG: hypothetical protein K6G61_02945, partial [Solobacterium sp.]|nr:hypothetical protein [Solobacterium sp.]
MKNLIRGIVKLTIALSCVMSGITGIYAEEETAPEAEVQEENRYTLKVSEKKDIKITEGTEVTVINENEESISAEQEEAGIITVEGLAETEDAVIRVIMEGQEELLHFEVVPEEPEEITGEEEYTAEEDALPEEGEVITEEDPEEWMTDDEPAEETAEEDPAEDTDEEEVIVPGSEEPVIEDTEVP